MEWRSGYLEAETDEDEADGGPGEDWGSGVRERCRDCSDARGAGGAEGERDAVEEKCGGKGPEQEVLD
jgi:hypothetical protein